MGFRLFKKIPLLTLFSLFVFNGLAFAQPRLTFQLSPSLELAQVVYVSDFDFIQQGASQYLFQIGVDNSGGPEVLGLMRFEVFLESEMIASSQTEPFNLMADEAFSASNIELSSGFVTPIGQYVLRFDESETQNPSDEFEQEVMEGGKLPKGNYSFRVMFRYTEPQDDAVAPPKTIFINNPTYITPVAPGLPVGAGMTDILYTSFPTFQFNSDYDPTIKGGAPFHVQIFKKLDQHGSIDEALTSTPHFDAWLSETVFAYQAWGVQPLDPGIYVWRIQLQLITSSGTEIMDSPVYTFRIEDPSILGNEQDKGVKDDILQLLYSLLGERAKEVIQSLSDYNLTSIQVNGETITKEQLYEIIADYQGQERLITDFHLLGTQK